MSSVIGSLKVSDVQFVEAVNRLGQFVAIASCSHLNNPEYSMQDLIRAAEFCETALRDLDFEVELLRIDNCAPFVIAQKIINESLPTVAFYSHYDVQPVDREKWFSDPFVVEERDGRIYGRGASDDKAGIIAILTMLKMYQEADRPLPINVKILFEGEEECSSEHLGPMLAQTAGRLEAQALVVLDGVNRGCDCGSLMSSTRGLVNITLEVKALSQPVHSGIGCLAPDPAMSLAVLVASLANPREIPGFMDGFQPMGDEAKEIYAASSQSAEAYCQECGVAGNAILRGDPCISVYQRIVEEPSLSIVNMTAGKPNGGNSIQDVARCQIGVRILPGQNPEGVAQSVIEYLKRQPILHNCEMSIQVKDGAWAWTADVSSGFSKKYLKALSENFSEAAVVPCGGALPLLRDFQKQYPDMELVVPGVEDPYTNAHSHNESQDLALFRKAINSLASFVEEAAIV